MQKNQIVFVAVGVLILGVLVIAFVSRGPGKDRGPGITADDATGVHASAAGVPGGGASAGAVESGRGPVGDTAANSRGDATVTQDVIGGTTSSRIAGNAGPGSGSDLPAGAVTPDTPMAARGRSLGIDTDMDEDWAPESEAAQWFEPLDAALGAASPLDPETFHSIIGDHRETAIDVFKRSGEIAEAQGPDVGMTFLDEWNALVEDYKREAYGKPPAD